MKPIRQQFSFPTMIRARLKKAEKRKKKAAAEWREATMEVKILRGILEKL